MTERMQKGLSVALIILLGIVCYANSLGNGFVWDDDSNVVHNRFLRSWRFLPRFFTTDIAEAYDTAASAVPVYRPLYMLSLLVDYQSWGPSPAMFHLTNVAWHVLSAVLIYFVLCASGIRSRWALVAALLFVSHPTNVENVALVAGRNAVMCISFMLLSLLLLLVWCQAPERVYRVDWILIVSIMAFALALLSKEVAASFPGIVAAALLILPVCSKIPRRRALAMIGIYGVVLTAYLITREVVLTQTSYGIHTSLAARCGLALESWALTIAMIVAPINLHHERSLPAGSAPAAALAGAGALALAVATWLAVGYWRRDRRVTFGIAFALIAFLPTSNLAPLNMTFGERWVSWPMIGLLVCGMVAVEYISDRSRMLERGIFVLAGGVIGLFAALTVAQNRVWHDEVTLFRTLIERGGDTARTRTALAFAYMDAGDLAAAKTQLQITLSRNARHVPSLRGMGILLLNQRRYRDAMEWFEKALEIDPTDSGTSLSLAHAQEQLGEMSEAELTLRDAVAHAASANMALELTSFYLRAGRLDDAERVVRAVLDKDRMHATAQNLLGTVEFRKGDLDKAEEHFRLALRYDRWLIGAYANLAAVADERGDLPGAIQFYSKALSLDPTNASVYYALGVVLNRHDQLDGARQALARAVELDPHFNEAKKLLEELTGTQATNEP